MNLADQPVSLTLRRVPVWGPGVCFTATLEVDGGPTYRVDAQPSPDQALANLATFIRSKRRTP